MALDAVTLPSLVTGLAFLALGGWVATLGVRRRLHWAFARLMAVWGTAMVALVFIEAPGDWADRTWFLAYAILPLATVDLGLAFRWAHRPAPTRQVLVVRRLVRCGLAAVALGLVVAHLASPSWATDSELALRLVLSVPPFALSAAGLALAEGARRLPPSPERGSRILFTSGFLLFPTFQGAFRLDDVVVNWRDNAWVDWLTLALALAGLLLSGTAAIRMAGREPAPEAGPLRRWGPALACGAAALAGFLPLAVEAVPGVAWGDIVLRALGGLCMLAFAACVAYAMVRNSLFGLDPRFGRIVRDSGFAALAAAVFFIVEQAMEQQFQDGLARMGWLGAVVPFLAAGAAALLLFPARHLADGVVDFLGGGDGRARHERRAGIYRAAVLAALQDGLVTPRERQALRRLAGSLGLPAKEAQAIEDSIGRRPARARAASATA